MATTGFSTTVQLDNAAGTPTTIGEAVSVTPYGYEVGTAESTHLTSTSGHREYISTLSDVGEATVAINHDQQSATDQLLRTAMSDRLVRTFKVTFPDSNYFQCECFVTGYTPGEVTADGKIEASFTVKFTGVPTFG